MFRDLLYYGLGSMFDPLVAEFAHSVRLPKILILGIFLDNIDYNGIYWIKIRNPKKRCLNNNLNQIVK